MACNQISKSLTEGKNTKQNQIILETSFILKCYKPSLIRLCLNSLANLSSSSRSIFSSAGRSSLPTRDCCCCCCISRGDIDLGFPSGENGENGDGESEVRGGGDDDECDDVVVVVVVIDRP